MGISTPVDLEIGPEGSLYYLMRVSGEVWKVSCDRNRDANTNTYTIPPTQHQLLRTAPTPTASATPPTARHLRDTYCDTALRDAYTDTYAPRHRHLL